MNRLLSFVPMALVALVAAKLNQRKAEMTILRLAEANRELHERIKNLSKGKNS